MARTGRPKAVLELTDDEREQLTRWARRAKSAQALALRSRIVLGCAEGLSNCDVAERERGNQATVGKWRRRFVEGRMDGLVDDPRPGRPPSITAWLARHPRFHMHYTPTYSSWINQVERFFAYITADLLQRSDHRSVHALEADIRAWIAAWNENPKPFIWTKTAEQILEKLDDY